MTKDELVAEVWPNTFVEEGNLAVSMTRLRQALNDASGQTYIETVPKKGYRVVAAIRELDIAPIPPAVDVMPPAPPAPPRNTTYLWAAALVVILLTIVGAMYWLRPTVPAPAADTVQSLVVTRFTAPLRVLASIPC